MSKTQNITTSILNKWRLQNTFIRFIDENSSNCSVTNLQYVSLEDAMKNITWKVDWDMNLTKAERKLVMDVKWRNGLTFNSNK